MSVKGTFTYYANIYKLRNLVMAKPMYSLNEKKYCNYNLSIDTLLNRIFKQSRNRPKNKRFRRSKIKRYALRLRNSSKNRPIIHGFRSSAIIFRPKYVSPAVNDRATVYIYAPGDGKSQPSDMSRNLSKLEDSKLYQLIIDSHQSEAGLREDRCLQRSVDSPRLLIRYLTKTIPWLSSKFRKVTLIFLGHGDNEGNYLLERGRIKNTQILEHLKILNLRLKLDLRIIFGNCYSNSNDVKRFSDVGFEVVTFEEINHCDLYRGPNGEMIHANHVELNEFTRTRLNYFKDLILGGSLSMQI